MKNKWKFGLIVFCCVTVAACLCSSAAYDAVFSWYCVRNKEHRQPTADTNMQWIEQYHGYYVDHAHGDMNEDKVIYLTFDAGYENGNVAKILDVLKDEQVPGAFFILENLIQRNAPLVRRMIDEGHIVGNHTAHHKDMTTVQSVEEFNQELDALNQLYYETFGQKMKPYYRPPEGKFNERSMGYANEMGYNTIFWSVAYADWDNAHQPSAQTAKAKLLDHMHNGAIILLHPTSATNAEILDEVIQTLKSEGYRFGTLDELTGQW